VTFAFQLAGTLSASPQGAAPSTLDATAELAESLTLGARLLTEVHLTADTPVTVPLAALASAAVLMLRATPATAGAAARVLAALSSADSGAGQIVAVDPFLLLMSAHSPVTALSLTRTAGVDTTVEVFLGEKAP
jgi:hypothetical protein